ncbi:hypothetical protein [Haemophilus influenzae]|uniref:hypothetical protein n=1 Tax=Haemophilus influenzae TaxID=727 RepID=UPI00128B153B|nr:hypothetical protein [Haemophilus influenzae]
MSESPKNTAPNRTTLKLLRLNQAQAKHRRGRGEVFCQRSPQRCLLLPRCGCSALLTAHAATKR